MYNKLVSNTLSRLKVNFDCLSRTLGGNEGKLSSTTENMRYFHRNSMHNFATNRHSSLNSHGNIHRLVKWKDMLTMWRIAISRDFFESDLPKPELSGDEADLPEWLPRGECLSSCFGGASFRIFITLSTIFVPIKTGLTLSLTLECPRLNAGTELPLV